MKNTPTTPTPATLTLQDVQAQCVTWAEDEAVHLKRELAERALRHAEVASLQAYGAALLGLQHALAEHSWRPALTAEELVDLAASVRDEITRLVFDLVAEAEYAVAREAARAHKRLNEWNHTRKRRKQWEREVEHDSNLDVLFPDEKPAEIIERRTLGLDEYGRPAFEIEYRRPRPSE